MSIDAAEIEITQQGLGIRYFRVLQLVEVLTYARMALHYTRTPTNPERQMNPLTSRRTQEPTPLNPKKPSWPDPLDTLEAQNNLKLRWAEYPSP